MDFLPVKDVRLLEKILILENQLFDCWPKFGFTF